MAKKGDEPTIKDTRVKVLEDLTIHAGRIQNEVLLQIINRNSNTEYLSRFNLHSSNNDINIKQVYKDRVPIVDYEDIKSYIQRIAAGTDSSNILCAQTVTEFFTSTGTSSGLSKLIPFTAQDLERRLSFMYLFEAVINKHFEGLDDGKAMNLLMIKQEITTPSGLVARPVATSLNKNDYVLNQLSNTITSPKETILCTDNKQSMYCQLLCGLVQRDKVNRVCVTFASVFLRAIKFLEANWKEMCLNIRNGRVSDWITNVSCRNAVSLVIGNPSSELADLIEIECSQRSWEGIIKRLWPGTKYINVVITGSMAQYVPTIKFYSAGLPLVSNMYASSECFFGINLEPLNKPSDVSYTLLPNMAYFEFLPVDKNHNELTGANVVDLVDVQVGHFYEILVTTFTGLYRYRVGDILMVTGFHNNAPQFRFVARRNVVLSIDMDKTTEDDLLQAIMQAKLPIEQLGFLLTDYTSYPDTTSIPGHYVLFWELINTHGDLDKLQVELHSKIMEECCYRVEEMLDSEYRRCRKNDKSIGPLEIRVVKRGTFDAMLDFHVSKGASMTQYKTPRCVKSIEAIRILNSGEVGNYFSSHVPSWEPFEIMSPSPK